MDFPSSGVSRNLQPSRGSSHHSWFGAQNSLFGAQQSGFGNGGNIGNNMTGGNQFNFPLRSRQLDTANGAGSSSSNNGQYSSYRSGNEGVLRQSMFGPPNQFHTQQNLMNKLVHRSPSSAGQKNKNNKHNVSSSHNGKFANGRDKTSNDTTGSNEPEQQYRIFKRGDTIAVSSTIASEIVTSAQSGPISSEPNLAISRVNEVQASEPNSEINQDVLKGTIIGTASLPTSHATSSVIENASLDTGKENQKASNGNNSRTTVSLVGEIAKFHGLQLEYRLVKETGPPHAPTFTVTLTLGTEEYQGCGSSIKKAQHAAATDAMAKTSFLKPPARSQPRRNYQGNGIGSGPKRPNWALIQLTSIANEMKEPLSFALQPLAIIDPFYRREPPSVVAVHVGDRMFTGEGPSFNVAKNAAAMVALKSLQREKQDIELARMLAEGTTPFQLEERSLNAENKSPISVVHEMAMKRGLTVTFDVTSESGPPHMKVFSVRCVVGELVTEGQGSTKQQAKKISSEMMMNKLREIHIPLPNAGGTGNTFKSIQRGFSSKPRVTKKKTTPVLKDVDKQLVSPISKLIQIAHAKKYKDPEFCLLAQPPETSESAALAVATQANKNDRRNKRKKTIFTIEVTVGPHVCQGTGVNKKSAKKAAADAALIALGCGTVQEAPESGIRSDMVLAEHGSQSSSPTKIKQSTTSPRQIVPGVLVIKSESSACAPNQPMQSAEVAQELIKVNNSSSSSQEGVDKLNYLAHLLDLKVSFSDFPKKNEFLSVVSFGATPPHVAHGIGSTLEEARNTAAQKILDELTDMGLDSVSSNSETTIGSTL